MELRNFCLILIKSGLNVSELNAMLSYNNNLGLATDELGKKLEKMQTILSVFVKISEFVAKSFKKQSHLKVQIPQHLSPKNLLEKISENVEAEKSDYKQFSIIKYNEKMLKWVGKISDARLESLIDHHVHHYLEFFTLFAPELHSKSDEKLLELLYDRLLSLDAKQFDEFVAAIKTTQAKGQPDNSHSIPFHFLALLAEDREIDSSQFVDVIFALKFAKQIAPNIFATAHSVSADQLKLLKTLALFDPKRQKQILESFKVSSMHNVEQLVEALYYKNLLLEQFRHRIFKIKHKCDKLASGNKSHQLDIVKKCNSLLHTCLDTFFELFTLRSDVVCVIFRHESSNNAGKRMENIDLTYHFEREIKKLLPKDRESIVDCLKKNKFDESQVHSSLDNYKHLIAETIGEMNNDPDISLQLFLREEIIDDADFNVNLVDETIKILRTDDSRFKLLQSRSALIFLRLIKQTKHIQKLSHEKVEENTREEKLLLPPITLTEAIQLIFDDPIYSSGKKILIILILKKKEI